jgi:PKD repeat protein
MPRRYRAIRRLGLAAALALVVLCLGQVVFAAPPQNVNFTVSPANPQVGQNVTFTSTATDPDGDIASWEWDFNYDGTNFDVEATGESTTRSFAQGGTRIVALRVTDTAGDPNAGGDGVVDTRLVQKPVNVIVPNQNPTASIASITRQPDAAHPNNGNVPYVGQPIKFDGAGTDPDGDPVTYAWDFGDGQTSTQEDPVHAYGTHGAKQVRLTVRDNRGGETTTPASTVQVNALPVANANILNQSSEAGQKFNTPLVGQSFVFSSQAIPAALGGPQPGSSDLNGSITSYAWDLDNNGTYETAGGTNSQCVGCIGHPGYPTAGQRTVGLRVTDNNAATATKTLTFRVNSAPVPGFIFDPQTPAVNKPVQFSSTSRGGAPGAEDEHEALTYAWDFDGNGTTDSTVPNPTRTFTTPGTRSVKLRVTDTGGITREISRPVLVQLSTPNAAFSSSPGSPLPGEPVTFTSTSSPSEPAKQITNVEWDFNYDRNTGTFTPDAVGTRATHTFPTPGVKTVAIRATEGPAGGFDIELGTVTVNAPPQASFSVAPESAFVGDPVTLASSSYDPDGRLERQDWDLDNDGQFDDASAAVVPAARFASAGTYPLKLRVTDSRGATSIASGKVTVQSRPVPPLQVLPGVEVEARFLLFARNTRVKFLRVRAPAGSKVSVRCLGKKNCPKRLTKMSKGPKKLQFKKLQRTFRPRTKLIITVTKGGFIGKQTTYTMRRRKPPIKRSLCLAPGAKKANACPSG